MNLMEFKDIEISNNILVESSIDGKDVINLYGNTSELSKRLNPYIQNKKPVNFLCWKVFSLNRFMLFLSREDYPVENFTKPYYKNGSSYKKRTVEDYWGIIISYLITLVRKDTELKELMFNNTLKYNAYEDKVEETTFLSTKLNRRTKFPRLHGYAKAVTYVSNIVTSGLIDDDDAIRLLLNRDFPNLSKSLEEIIKK